jgi:hypothetical protein
MTKPSIVQNGWRIRSSDGVDLGTVIDASGDTLLVDDESGGRWSVPKEDIAEEEDGSMLATLSTSAAQVRPADLAWRTLSSEAG